MESKFRRRGNHSVFRVADKNSDQQVIELNTGETISHTNFFADTHKITLQHPDWPLIQIDRSSKFLPIELCYVQPNQVMPRYLIDPDLQSRLTDAANSMPPLKRFEKIQQSRDAIVSQDVHKLMQSFGLTIAKDPIKVMGRQLREPKFEGNLHKLADPVKEGLQRYLVFNFSQKVNRNFDEYYKNFFGELDPNNTRRGPPEGLLQTATHMGLSIAGRPLNTGREITADDLTNFNKAMDAFERYKTVNRYIPDIMTSHYIRGITVI